MNPGTFYLYEYENNKRRRNVGFIKTARHYRSCILQIHAAGIPAGNGASLELYAFFLSGQDLIAEQIAVLNCFRRNISARLPLSETTFPEGRPLSQIDGFLICLPGNRHTLFWMASDLFFDVDISRMRIPSREQACADIRAAGAAELPVRSETLVRSEAPAQPDTPDSAVASQQPDTPPSSAEPDQPSAKKIGRSDIARLPRKFWPLANNSFLLHGYHNYSHLMLIEEGGRAWLGVPGIYSPQEARAADLFGFPRFTRSFAAFPELAEEERSASSDFGHWCRCVGQNIPFIS
ncbi:DUF6128 domain-containing protein [Lachnoclostridium sp. An76]|uniref:DUF6128 domain-containing protein n=1 Tax=Lachnoclostridium sp. An76 TaxID=1965654 RepID=UPI000B3AAAC7|nr:DUF6128 domain-containing protein [Lachnoclostridium sp. An76]OUN35145.1 hypothetical protein B5G27_05745 [Lachnoclostridium sp. An76]